MRDYNKGKIYKLVCNDTGLVYYGHTTYEYLSQRLAKHKCDYKIWVKGNGDYVSSFEIIKNNNYDIILMELYPCGSKAELKARERYYIENNECVNKNIPNRTKKEYYEDNKDKLKVHFRNYYENHKEEKKEHSRICYERNKDNILKRCKQYNENHKEEIKRRDRIRYERNKDVINKNRRKKVVCECGSEVCRGYLSSHRKNEIHFKNLNSIK